VRFFCCPVAPLKLIDRKVRFQAYASCHASILQHLRHKWYQIVEEREDLCAPQPEPLEQVACR
jgi:hypothetical protein